MDSAEAWKLSIAARPRRSPGSLRLMRVPLHAQKPQEHLLQCRSQGFYWLVTARRISLSHSTSSGSPSGCALSSMLSRPREHLLHRQTWENFTGDSQEI